MVIMVMVMNLRISSWVSHILFVDSFGFIQWLFSKLPENKLVINKISLGLTMVLTQPADGISHAWVQPFVSFNVLPHLHLFWLLLHIHHPVWFMDPSKKWYFLDLVLNRWPISIGTFRTLNVAFWFRTLIPPPCVLKPTLSIESIGVIASINGQI